MRAAAPATSCTPWRNSAPRSAPARHCSNRPTTIWKRWQNTCPRHTSPRRSSRPPDRSGFRRSTASRKFSLGGTPISVRPFSSTAAGGGRSTSRRRACNSTRPTGIARTRKSSTTGRCFKQRNSPREVSMALQITDLSKTYPNGVRALKDLSLTIGNNMFGLLGPNGAGKSSLMRTIATLQDPDAGSISLDGLNVLTQKNEVRKILGYLPQEFGVYPKMSAVDMLNHLAILKGVIAKGERSDMVDALLHQTNLWEARKKALSTYSGGMKQRFGIAQALLANPRLIIVDEPTAGLDPAERNRFLNLLSSIGRDVTVILSTHIVDDVRELCSRMAIIASGEVLLEGSPTEALLALDGQMWSRIVSTDEELRTLESELHIVSTHLVGGQHEIRVFAPSSPGANFRAVASELEDIYFLHLSRRSKT